jgi:hypothetical protein
MNERQLRGQRGFGQGQQAAVADAFEAAHGAEGFNESGKHEDR